MKIVCDNCSTKYSIADEKVRGKIFKIKCKKCSHIIVVKGQEASGEGPAAGFDQKDTRVFDYSGFEGQKEGPAADPIWHLVIDREQVGPLTVAELAQKWTAGEVDIDTYAWREGFDDWKRLGAIEELSSLVRREEIPAPATARSESLFGGAASPAASATGSGRADPTDLFAAAGTSSEEEAPAGDLFGGRGGAGAAQPAVFASSNAPATAAPADKPLRRAPKEDQPLFSLSAAEGGGNGFGTDPVPKIESRPMTAQRNENSVLFSLNNLAALATGAADPSPPKSSVGSNFSTSGPEGSGLIDIRAMAAMTMGGGRKEEGPRTRASEDDLPVFSASSFSTPAATVLLPAQHTPTSTRTIYMLVGVLGFLIVVAIVLLVVIFVGGRKPVLVNDVAPAPAAATTPPATAASTPPPTTTTPTAPATATATPPPVAATTPAPAATTAPPPSSTPPPPAATPPPSPQRAATPPAPAPPVRDKKKPDAAAPRVAATEKAPPDKSAEPPKPAEPPPVRAADPPKPVTAQKCDEVACLVTPDLPCCPKRGGTAAAKPSAAGAADSSLPDKLDQADIIAGMKNVNPRVLACNDKAKGAGQFKIRITVGSDGNVSNAQALPPVGGTPAAGCVESAVKAAKFKRTKQPITFNYPYTFR